ncbi:hypothetical protein DCS_00056 [Drechmeria coniospora]|uniref:Secreted protein n=1 Tax=Drechmeria coniospora TaxID=98403 RepID=A0A151GP90_DRECN|nr:hypothetical protein DCS_00056 [Drechmeria coniospora]KYK58929.1 hypothetical protein DCS_00056 [Drechmeria coniospora]
MANLLFLAFGPSLWLQSAVREPNTVLESIRRASRARVKTRKRRQHGNKRSSPQAPVISRAPTTTVRWWCM